MTGTMPQRRPRKERKENADRRRRQLLDATRRSIAANGLQRTTFDTVADQAGLSRSIAGFYFKSKTGLLAETLRDLNKIYERHWKAALDAAGEDPIVQLVALIRADFDPLVFNSDFIFSWYALWGETHFLVLSDSEDADSIHLGRTQASKDILTSLLSDEPDRAAEISLVLEAVIDGFWNEGHMNPKGTNPEELLAITLRCLATYLPEHREAILNQP